MKASFSMALLQLVTVAAALRVPAPAPSNAPSAAPSPQMNAVAVTFEISNYNYEDLDAPLEQPQEKLHEKQLENGAVMAVDNRHSNTMDGLTRYAEAAGAQAADTSKDVAEAGHDTVHHNTNHVADGVKTTSDSANHHAKQATDASHRAFKKGAHASHHTFKKTVDRVHGGITTTADGVREHTRRNQASMMQAGVSIVALVRDVLRDTLRDTVDEIVEHFLPNVTAAGPSAAPAPAQAAFLDGVAPAPAPASAPAGPPEHRVDVFVQITPGKEHPLADGHSVGKSTLVEVTISGKPNSGVDELPAVMAALSLAKKNGDLQQWLQGAMYEVTALIPTMAHLKLVMAKVTQWTTAVCEKHMQRVVKLFSAAYTRRMVPTAIYNECTNYVPYMSFSHDHIANRFDEDKCRDATIKFATRWKFGKNPSGKNVPALLQTPMDFGEFCVDVCEAKYGLGAHRCHVSEGKKLGSTTP